MAEGGAVSEICVSNRPCPEKKKIPMYWNLLIIIIIRIVPKLENSESIKDSNVLESFNKKDSTETRKTIKDSENSESFNKRIVPKYEK